MNEGENRTGAVPVGRGMDRRHFLRGGSAALLGLTPLGAVRRPEEINCIFLFLVGGPSQLDTWDMKPEAPAHIRGPYRPIKTNVSGIEISEVFPRMARQADKYALIRSVYHKAAAVHDTGHQMMQTGRLFQEGVEHPHAGCALGKFKGARGAAPAHVVLPHPIGNTGGNLSHGQGAGVLGAEHDPVFLRTDQFDLRREPDRVRRDYGLNSFGQSCLMARRLVEAGTRFVTVNMFETVFDQITWDIHGSRPFSPIGCYRESVGPMFDMAFSSLLEDLSQRGMLQSTLVVATGEFGRTPHINPLGGRDHWPSCWTMLMAGGGVRGGQVIGSSDRIGAEPKDRPVTPAEIVATIYHALGLPLSTELGGCEGRPVRLVEPGVEPVRELFA